MTPLEKARDAFKGQWKDNVLLFDNAALDRDLKAAIRAFLEAAAEDERVARAIFFRGEDMGDDAWNHCQRHLREIAKEQAAAAILALKETINAS